MIGMCKNNNNNNNVAIRMPIRFKIDPPAQYICCFIYFLFFLFPFPPSLSRWVPSSASHEWVRACAGDILLLGSHAKQDDTNETKVASCSLQIWKRRSLLYFENKMIALWTSRSQDFQSCDFQGFSFFQSKEKDEYLTRRWHGEVKMKALLHLHLEENYAHHPRFLLPFLLAETLGPV